MKKIFYLICCLILCQACSEEAAECELYTDIESSDYVKQLDAIIPDFVNIDNVTRTDIIKDNQTLQLVWDINDTIGIFPEEGFQVAFSMAKGAGLKNASFDGGGWGLIKESVYSAYYPLIGQFYLDKTKIPMSLDSQIQNGNGSHSHIGATDYMIAINSHVDEDGTVAFNFQHLVSVLHMQFKLPSAGEFTKLMLLTSGSFVTKASIDLTNGTVTPLSKSPIQILDLNEVFISEGEILDLYMTIVPVNLEGKTLEAKIFDNEGNCYTATLTGCDYEAGAFYNSGKKATLDPTFNTKLPVVIINTPDNVAITSKTDWTKNSSITILNSNGITDYSDNTLQIRGRGNSTWSYPKKPYALKLNKKNKILGMPSHKRWVLLANWMDRTLLRNDVTFQIAKQTGLAWTPRGQFVEVILNGSHMGNYYLCEQIKVDNNRVNIAGMTETDLEGDAITGGYLLELDVTYDEVNKFKSAIKEFPYMFKEPDEEVLQPAQLAYLENYVNEMETKLYAENWLTNREYADYIDLASFVDWWFVHELSMNWEPNYPRSSYMHKDRLGKLVAGPVWDFDMLTYTPRKAGSYTVKQAIYYERLFSDPVFVSLVKERWSMFKSKFEQISNYVRIQASKIKSSNEIDKALWPMSANSAGSMNGDQDMTFDDAVERLISSYETKLAWLDTQISKMR